MNAEVAHEAGNGAADCPLELYGRRGGLPLVEPRANDRISWTFTIMPYLGDFGIIAAIFSLILGWKKRSPIVWTMTAGLGWMLLMSAIRGENVLAAEWQYLKEGIIAFLVLAPLPGCLTENRFRQFLKGTIAVWMTAITCQAAIGLWAAISGHAVFSMKGTWYIGMNLGDHRLYLNAYVTTAAAKWA